MRSKHAFTFLEVIITLVVLSLIGGFLAIGTGKVFDNFSDKNAKDRLLLLGASQLQFFENRGRFTQNVNELIDIEPSYTYVEQGISAEGDAISVAVNNDTLAMATRSKDGKCFLLKINPTASALSDYSAVTPNASNCNASDALLLSGGSW